MRSFISIALNAFMELVRQPIFLLLMTTSSGFCVFIAAVPYFGFGEDPKLVKDMSLALMLLSGLFGAVLCASSSVAQEIRLGTALTVLSKPVGRWTFLTAKYVGLSASLALMTYSNVIAALLAGRMAFDAYGDTDVRSLLIYGGSGAMAYAVAGFFNFFLRRGFVSDAVFTFILFTTLSVLPEDAPDKPEYVTLDFVKGDCVAVNGKKLTPLQVMRTLNKIGGKHGVGRVDMVENRFVGMKSRGVYETPGGSILHYAHRQMESLTMDREVMHQRDAFIPKYAELVYNGFWYAPERLALQAYVEESQKNVTGTVRVKLYKGGMYVAGRKSQFSMYNPHIATMEADPTKAYNQDDATGFIRLNGLRLRVNSTVNGAKNLQG